MALGARVKKEQDTLFYFYPGDDDVLKPKGGSFYAAFDELLEENGFDAFVEDLCRSSYASVGRPGLPPGVYFRMMMVGYLEGIPSERRIAWQCHNRLDLRIFLYGSAMKPPPDHSTVSRTRRRLSREIHVQVFAWVLGVIYDAGLLEGKTLGVDSTTLQANASMRALRRREDGTPYEEFLEQLAKASGIETPTREELIKLDRRRPKKASNREWESPTDPEARIAKMKDGRTRFAHKFEQAADMESGAVVAVTVQSTAGGDCASIEGTLDEASRHLEEEGLRPEEVVCDKGYHSNATMKSLKARGLRSYVSEPNRGRRNWTRDPDAKAPTRANRRRIRGERGRRLLRMRREKLERNFAHLLNTGGMRRVHLRGRENVEKRLLIHASAFNLSLIFRKAFGGGTPRGPAGRLAGRSMSRSDAGDVFSAFFGLISRVFGLQSLETRFKRRILGFF